MIRIGCVQSNPLFGDTESNLRSFEQFLLGADADLLVFPELALTGYFFSSSVEAKRFAEPIDGSIATKLKRIAKDHRVAIVTGFLEDDHGVLYNSAIAIDRHGNLIGHYRKVHLFYYEKVVFSPGNLGFPVYGIEVRNGETVKLGIQICYDWRFPEATRSLALHGAEVIAMPSNIVTTTGMLLETLKVRAFENKVIIAFADRIGSEKAYLNGQNEELLFRGESCIINYNGDVLSLSSTQEESIAYANVLTENTRSKDINIFNDIINDRRTNAYFT
jgi:predicted amidohydrolase